MTDNLTEAVAMGLWTHEHEGYSRFWHEHPELHKNYIKAARTIIAAIEASGTHVVVPSALTDQMLSALHDQATASLEAYGVPLSIPDRWKDICHDQYAAMLAARPKVLE